MFQIVVISFLSIVIGLLGLILVIQMTHYITKRPISFQKLFDGLHSKLWMTAGLGFFFACLYPLIVFLISWALDENTRQSLFNMAYHHPVYFIYAGLATFAFISIGILGVRSVIKRVYNSKR